MTVSGRGYKDLYVVERVDDSTSTQLSHWLWYGLGEKIDSVLGENAQVGLWRMQSGRAKIARTDNLEHGSYAQNLSASVATVRAFGLSCPLRKLGRNGEIR